MLYSGLLSITFRQLNVDQIIELTIDASLKGIEWGADVHVLPGDLDHAKKVKAKCDEAHIEIPTYGSYYRVGIKKNDSSFEDVLNTTCALEAPVIRVWVGNKDSQDVSAEDWKSAIEDLKRICKLAAGHDVKIAMEYHRGTLNNIPESCERILSEVNAPNLVTFWQTTNGADDATCLQTLKQLSHHILHAHIFNWNMGSIDQTLLSDGEKRWESFMLELAKIEGDRFASIEFVKDGSIDNFKKDAETLKQWLKTANEFQPSHS